MPGVRGDVSASLVLSERFDAARRFRDSSKKEAGRQLASLPQLFGSAGLLRVITAF